MHRLRAFVLCSSLVMAACDGSMVTPSSVLVPLRDGGGLPPEIFPSRDGGSSTTGPTLDGGSGDAGSNDAGASGLDGGLVDAGLPGGVTDGGFSDGGAGDGGPTDAGIVQSILDPTCVFDGGGPSHLIGSIVESDNDTPIQGATVTVLAPGGIAPLVTNADGSYGFYVPQCVSTYIRSEAPNHMPWIRSIVSRPMQRPRNHLLFTWEELDQVSAFLTGAPFDRGGSILSVQFRNRSDRAATERFCLRTTDVVVGAVPFTAAVYADQDGFPQVTTEPCMPPRTQTSSDRFILLGVRPGLVRFEATTADGQREACIRCDAEPMPVVAGTQTHFDFECNLDRGGDTCQ